MQPPCTHLFIRPCLLMRLRRLGWYVLPRFLASTGTCPSPFPPGCSVGTAWPGWSPITGVLTWSSVGHWLGVGVRMVWWWLLGRRQLIGVMLLLACKLVEGCTPAQGM